MDEEVELVRCRRTGVIALVIRPGRHAGADVIVLDE
jgi:hypothetical protein